MDLHDFVTCKMFMCENLPPSSSNTKIDGVYTYEHKYHEDVDEYVHKHIGEGRKVKKRVYSLYERWKEQDFTLMNLQSRLDFRGFWVLLSGVSQM